MNSSMSKDLRLESRSIHEIREDIRRIVVDADWLLKVKSIIIDVMDKKVEEIMLRREIYLQAERVVDKLLEYLPFLIELLHPRTDNKEIRKLKDELKEKSSILAQIDTKIKSLYTKLIEKK